MESEEQELYKNRKMILFNVVLMTFMATLDGSIVNVALPVLSEKLGVTTSSVSWVVTAYLIAISGTILIFGRLGDIVGKTKVFKFGVLLFAFGSLLCSVSGSLVLLVVARVVQAVGAAGAMATNQGIITQVFPKSERGRALGISGTFVALGSMAGPPLGGFILDALSWQYIFLINVPIGIVVFILGMKILPRTEQKVKEPLDGKGAALFAAATVALFGALIIGQEVGYGNPAIIAAFAFAVVTLLIFIRTEKKSGTPLLQLDIFKNRLFSLSIFCGFISFVAISCSNILLPFYLQNTMKYSPSVTGLIMMVYPIVLSVVAPISGHLSDKIGSELLTLLGLIFTSLGLYLMAILTAASPLHVLLLIICVMSLGNGMFQSPNTSLIMSNAPGHMLGIAGSVNALVRNLGMIFGTALSITLLYGRMSSKIGYHISDYIVGRDDVFIYGMKGVYIAAGTICLLGVVLTAYRLLNRKKARTD